MYRLSYRGSPSQNMVTVKAGKWKNLEMYVNYSVNCITRTVRSWAAHDSEITRLNIINQLIIVIPP
jgi:hypothetical protein